MTSTPEFPNSLDETIFVGGGEMATLMRSHNWAQTPLGAIETWSPALVMMIRLLLANRFPLILWWGPHYIQFYNDSYRPILGTKHPQSLGQAGSKCWTEIWQVIEPLIDRPFQGETATWMEDILLEVNRHSFVEETHFTIAYSPVPDETAPRGIGGVLGTVHEITEKVISERRVTILRDMNARVGEAKTAGEVCTIAAETLAKHPQDVPFSLIYLVSPDGKQASLSGVAGTTVDEQISPRIVNLDSTHQDGLPLAQALQTETMQVIEDLGSRFSWVPPGVWSDPPNTAVILPLRSNKAHQFVGLLVVGISPRLKLDQSYCSFLELMTTQIAAAIANARAYAEERQRAEALAELDRAKTVFFSNVSHEFRTPLTLMLSPLEELSNRLSGQLPPDQWEQLQLIQRNGLRLQKLVNTLLDFSQIEAGRVQASYEPTDLAAYTAELASVFRSLTEQAGVTLVIDCPPLPEPMYIDREMWEKIVLNLISNAFKFTFTGEIRVSLRVGERGIGGEATLLSSHPPIILEVCDTGIGIPAAEMGHLFERFYRVKGVQGRTFEGSGIGLSLVQELVKLHGGTVEVSSVEGEGSCFRVLIPTGYAHLPAERIGASRTLASTGMEAIPYVEEALRWLPEESGRVDERMNERVGEWENSSAPFTHTHLPIHPSPHPPKILLVDDNADMRDYLKRLLNERWQVETAANGAIALALIQQQLPDLVLTDVMMPQVDGFQLLKTLRADPITQSIPIILLSARAGEEATVEGLEAGADDYLIKPFSARELIARVQTQLQMSRLRQELSANRFKNEFLMTVTHELQSPLATILGWARFLQTKALEPDAMARALAAIERNATIEAKLIKNLLDVASILSGKLRLKSQIVDLASLVRNVTTSFRATAESKNIQLFETISSQVPSNVFADGDLLKQVIANLLENAIKFTPEGGQVTIQLEHLNAGVQISVSDTGSGIRPDFLPYVFDRFTQAEVPSRHTPGGVGIGLAIARYIVELHQGTIKVASEGEGRGATFIVKLPLISAAQIKSDSQGQE